MRYAVVKHADIDALCRHVNALLEDGWTVLGGVTMCNVPFIEKGELSGKMINGNERHYAQTVLHPTLPPTTSEPQAAQKRLKPESTSA